jgi:beta-glucanase (GH16 family)
MKPFQRPKILFKVLVLLAVPLAQAPGFAQTWVLQPRYSDEFNFPAGTPLDPGKWDFLPSNSFSSSELQRFTDWQYDVPAGSHTSDYNVRSTDSSIQIVSRKQASGGYQYTSAGIRSKCKMAFTYGKIEFRIKPPAATVSGLWPSIWMMGNNSGTLPGCTAPTTVPWPDCGEIDMWTYRSLNPASYIASGFCNAACAATQASDIATGSQAGVWRKYSCQWDSIGVKYWYRNDGDPQDSMRGLTTKSFAGCPCFKSDMFFTMEMIIGGALGGTVNCAFPETLEVDYIRTYKSTTDPQTQVAEAPALPGAVHPAAAGLTFCAGRSAFRLVKAVPSQTRIDLFDAKGRFVATVVNAYLQAGPHDFQWNPKGAGVFVARVRNGESVASCGVALF